MLGDPLLGQDDANGIYRPRPGITAVRDADGRYAYVTTDLNGQPRALPATAGADQISGEPVINRVLTVDDVGPGTPGDR